MLVVDKPAGMLSVPGKKPEDGASVIDVLKTSGYPDARAVHRLDMATSGLLVIALGVNPLRHLSAQFEKRQVEKTYHATVYGCPDQVYGIINEPLICDYPNRPLQKICYEFGKPAVTRWRTVKKIDDKRTLLELKPETGRSHQLRVHCAHLGHPIIGDNFYAEGDALALSDRLELYATHLSIHHPFTDENMNFKAPYPYID